MNPQLTIFDIKESRRKRDEGMNRATDTADKTFPGWSNMAYELLKEFLSCHSGTFMTEEVRSYAAMKDNFPLPYNARAWGSVVTKARINGLIRSVGIKQVSNVRAHCANANVWIKV